MAESLAGRLHTLRVEQLRHAAETIRNWPVGPERFEQAVRHIREAMYLCATGKLTQVEESQIFSILSFAMPHPDSTFDADELPR